MFDFFIGMIGAFIDDLTTGSIHDSGSNSAPTSEDTSLHTTSEPDWQSAFGTGPDFIVPSEADSACHNFDFTDTTYGSHSDFDRSSWSSSDWDC